MGSNVSNAVRKILDTLEPLSRDEAVRALDAVDVVYDPLEAGREVKRPRPVPARAKAARATASTTNHRPIMQSTAETMARIESTLRERGPMRATDLAEALGMTCKTRQYKTARDRLVEQQKIRCSSPTPAGKWALTEAA